MRTILVSGASGIVGYGVLRSLRRANQDFQLIGTSIYNDSVAQGFCDSFELAPPTDSPGYLEWLLNTIEEEGYRLRSQYAERKSLATGLHMGWLALSSIFTSRDANLSPQTVPVRERSLR